MTGLRCAIYTRKSTEEGLDQGFNTLHAQRAACEAYVLSQAGEGWSALPTLYDDGGFTGGNMDRPGLKALLDDITAGKVDVVVVYKVDRLTRSLTDFARIVERFDQHKVSFVSVTQAFNTTTSMGRLTLNVLLSFAQFEREVTSERIRDKILASKQKGLWMGALAPIGYDPPADPKIRILQVNPLEAETVRMIFRKYLELGSVHRLAVWLKDQGVRTKRRVTEKGKVTGDIPFDRGGLLHLLRNRTYLGEIPHRDLTYPGQHSAIVDQGLFDEVQALLNSKVQRKNGKPSTTTAMPLVGLVFDADGERMSPSVTRRQGGKLYRYYISQSRLRGGSSSRSPTLVQRAPADFLEPLVQGAVARLSAALPRGWTFTLDRVEVHPNEVQVGLTRRSSQVPNLQGETPPFEPKLPPGERLWIDPNGPARCRLAIPCRFRRQGLRSVLATPRGKPAVMRIAPDRLLIKALTAAHQTLAGEDGRIGAVEDHTLQAVSPNFYQRSLGALVYLAPDIQAMILEGRQPSHLSLAWLIRNPLPASWAEQRRVLEIET